MFNENLKILRKQKGLSQEELAERLHVVRANIICSHTYSRIECNEWSAIDAK